jgi:hypothetical protein
MGEELVVDDGGVVVYVDIFDGEGWDFGDENATKGICNRGIDSYQGKAGLERIVFVELDFEVLNGFYQHSISRRMGPEMEKGYPYISKSVEGPLMPLAGPVAWEVCGGDICYCFCIDADNLFSRPVSSI